MKIILLAFLMLAVSCTPTPKGAEVSLRVNGIPVFMSQAIDKVDVAGGYVMVELDAEDSERLKLYIDEFYKDGGNVDVYIAEKPYIKNLYLESSYSDAWSVLKLPWIEAKADIFVKEDIEVNYLSD